MHNQWTATGWRQCSKWGQSGALYKQCVGYCVWWWLEQCWCYCSVPAARILYSRSDRLQTILTGWATSLHYSRHGSYSQLRICIKVTGWQKIGTHASMYLFQQMQLPLVMPILVLAVAQYTCKLLAALEGRLTLLIVLKFTPVSVYRRTQTMLEWDVKVWKVINLNGEVLNRRGWKVVIKTALV